MSLRRSNLVSSSSDPSDFIINTGSSGNTTVVLPKNFPAGTYTVTSSLGDTSYDMYLVASDDTSAGYINNTSSATVNITATKPFNTVVIYGSSNNDTITFTYRYFLSPSTDSTSLTAVGPRISSLSTNVLPNIDSSMTITGKNFASNVSVSFVGSDNVSRPAKSVTRNSSTQIVVVRPDTLPLEYEPYTVIVSNPGIASPTSTNLNRVGSLDAGTAPTWTTAAGDLPTIFTKNAQLSQSVVATDSDAGGGVTYSIVSGSLPAGLTLNTSTGVISGTATGNFTGRNNITIRATDAGGYYVERSFTLINNPMSESDTFNRTTSGNLGSTDSAQASIWVNTRGTWQADGSKATSSNIASDNSIATVDMATSNITNLQADVDNTGGVGIAFWVSDANSWYAATTYYLYTSQVVYNCVSQTATSTDGYPSTCCGGQSTYQRYSINYDCSDGSGGGAGGRTSCSTTGLCSGSSVSWYECSPYTVYRCTSNVQPSTVVSYSSQFRIINNGSAVIDTQYATSGSAFTTGGSIAISTSGNTISYSLYSGTGKSGSVLHSGSYTPGSPTKGTRVGVYKGDGGSVQGSSVDNFSVTVS